MSQTFKFDPEHHVYATKSREEALEVASTAVKHYVGAGRVATMKENGPGRVSVWVNHTDPQQYSKRIDYRYRTFDREATIITIRVQTEHCLYKIGKLTGAIDFYRSAQQDVLALISSRALFAVAQYLNVLLYLQENL